MKMTHKDVSVLLDLKGHTVNMVRIIVFWVGGYTVNMVRTIVFWVGGIDCEYGKIYVFWGEMGIL